MKMKSKLNAGWHKDHPMPKEPTLKQRIDWHVEHHKHCGCRDIPGKVKTAMKKMHIKIK
ncbi:MAG: hypothetical protein ACHQEB_02260 [Chitinophagales bacterium]